MKKIEIEHGSVIPFQPLCLPSSLVEVPVEIQMEML
jgi:hypothetical protein